MVCSILLNFNELCDAYTVQKQSYTKQFKLLKSNRIFCLTLEVIFWNYFITVSNEDENYFRLYFVFLCYLPCYKKSDCYFPSYRHSNNLNSILSSSCWKAFIIYTSCIICLSCLKYILISNKKQNHEQGTHIKRKITTILERGDF